MKTLKINKIGIKVPHMYETPAIEIFEVEVEKGFAASEHPTGDTPPAQTDGGTSPSGGGTWSNGPWH